MALLFIITDVRRLQPLKASSPMLVTLLGISIEIRPLQPWKALPPMLVTLLGIIVFSHPLINLLVEVFMIALQLSRESYTGFPSFTTIDVRRLQPMKASSPMLVTLFGISIDVRRLQPMKASSPMLVTLFGISIDVRPLQL